MLWAGLALLVMPIAHGQTPENVVVQTAADVRMRAEAPTLRLCRHQEVVAPLNLTARMESAVPFTNCWQCVGRRAAARRDAVFPVGGIATSLAAGISTP